MNYTDHFQHSSPLIPVRHRRRPAAPALREQRELSAYSAQARAVGNGSEQEGFMPAKVGPVRRLARRLLLSPEEQRAVTTLPWATGGELPTSAPVTFNRAASLYAMFACWRYLADQIATLPLHAYRDLGDRRQRMPSLPQLFQQPSVQGTLVDWLHRLIISMASRGNAVGLVTSRDGFGFPTGLEWLNISDIYCDERSFARPDWYLGGRLLPRDDVVHIPWFPVAGKVMGLSPMGAYAATVNAGLSAQQYATNWFDGGGVPPGTYQNTAKTLNPDEIEAIKARLVNAIRTHQPIVYGSDWQYAPITINPFEAQFVESQKLSATQIAAIYGVPPEKVGGEAGGSLTYNTVELNQLAMQQDTVLPWVVRLEAAFFKLLPERQYIKFAMDGHVRSDAKTRWEIYQLARQIGARSVDEVRELEDLEPLPDGQGGNVFTPQPLLEKGIGTVPRPGAQTPPATVPTGELGRPRLVEGGQG